MTDEEYEGHLHDAQWVMTNESIIKNVFPKVWTHVLNLKRKDLILDLIDLGIKFDDEELENDRVLTANLVEFFIDCQFLEVKDNYLIRANPDDIF